MDRAQDDLYSLLGGAASGMEAPIGDPKIPCAPPAATVHGAAPPSTAPSDENAQQFALPLP